MGFEFRFTLDAYDVEENNTTELMEWFSSVLEKIKSQFGTLLSCVKNIADDFAFRLRFSWDFQRNNQCLDLAS